MAYAKNQEEWEKKVAEQEYEDYQRSTMPTFEQILETKRGQLFTPYDDYMKLHGGKRNTMFRSFGYDPTSPSAFDRAYQPRVIDFKYDPSEYADFNREQKLLMDSMKKNGKLDQAKWDAYVEQQRATPGMNDKYFGNGGELIYNNDSDVWLQETNPTLYKQLMYERDLKQKDPEAFNKYMKQQREGTANKVENTIKSSNPLTNKYNSLNPTFGTKLGAEIGINLANKFIPNSNVDSEDSENQLEQNTSDGKIKKIGSSLLGGGLNALNSTVYGLTNLGDKYIQYKYPAVKSMENLIDKTTGYNPIESERQYVSDLASNNREYLQEKFNKKDVNDGNMFNTGRDIAFGVPEMGAYLVNPGVGAAATFGNQKLYAKSLGMSESESDIYGITQAGINQATYPFMLTGGGTAAKTLGRVGLSSLSDNLMSNSADVVADKLRSDDGQRIGAESLGDFGARVGIGTAVGVGIGTGINGVSGGFKNNGSSTKGQGKITSAITDKLNDRFTNRALGEADPVKLNEFTNMDSLKAKNTAVDSKTMETQIAYDKDPTMQGMLSDYNTLKKQTVDLTNIPKEVEVHRGTTVKAKEQPQVIQSNNPLKITQNKNLKNPKLVNDDVRKATQEWNDFSELVHNEVGHYKVSLDEIESVANKYGIDYNGILTRMGADETIKLNGSDVSKLNEMAHWKRVMGVNESNPEIQTINGKKKVVSNLTEDVEITQQPKVVKESALPTEMNVPLKQDSMVNSKIVSPKDTDVSQNVSHETSANNYKVGRTIKMDDGVEADITKVDGDYIEIKRKDNGKRYSTNPQELDLYNHSEQLSFRLDNAEAKDEMAFTQLDDEDVIDLNQPKKDIVGLEPKIVSSIEDFKKGDPVNIENGRGRIVDISKDNEYTVIDQYGTKTKLTKDRFDELNPLAVEDQMTVVISDKMEKADRKFEQYQGYRYDRLHGEKYLKLNDEINVSKNEIDKIDKELDRIESNKEPEEYGDEYQTLIDRREQLIDSITKKQDEQSIIAKGMEEDSKYSDGTDYKEDLTPIKTSSQIEADKPNKSTWDSVKLGLRTLMNKTVDKTRAIKYFEEKAWELAVNVKAHQNTAKYIINEGLVGLDKNPILKKDGKTAFGSFASLFDGFDKKTVSEYVNYLTLKAHIERADIKIKVQESNNGKLVYDENGKPVIKEITYKRGKPIMPKVSRDEAIVITRKIESEFPEFAKRSEDFKEWWKAYQDEYFVKGNLADDSTIKMYQELYQNYVTAKRVGFEKSDNITLNHKAKGSSRVIIYPPESMVKMIEATSQKVAVNNMKKAVYDVLVELKKEGKTSEYGEALGSNYRARKGEIGVGYVLIDGKKYYYKINDSALKEAMENTEKSVAAQWVNKRLDMKKYLGKNGELPSYGDIARLHKSLATKWNPVFAMYTNQINDYFTYMMNTDMKLLEANSRYWEANKQLKGNTAEAQRYRASGVSASSRYQNLSAEDIADLISQTSDPRTKMLLGKILNKMGDGLDTVSFAKTGERFESRARLATFNKVLEETGDIETAIFKAMDSTVNFGMYGSLSKKTGDVLGSFLTTQVAGLDRMGRNFSNKGKTIKSEFINNDGLAKFSTLGKEARKIAVLYTMPTVAEFLMNKNNPNYDELPQRQKDLYYNIPIPDFKENGTEVITQADKFIKIPKGRIYGLIFSSLLERGLQGALNDKGGKAFSQLGSAFSTELPDPTASMYDGVVGSFITNKDWANRTVEPQYYKDNYLSKDRYFETTSGTAKFIGNTWLAEKLDISPIQLDNVIKSYSYFWGNMLSNGIDVITGEKLPMEGVNRAIGSKFIVDPVYSNESTTNFYNDQSGITKSRNSIVKANGGSSDTLKGQSKRTYNNYGDINKIYTETQKDLDDLKEKIRNAKTTKEKETLQAQKLAVIQKANAKIEILKKRYNLD